MVNYLEGIPLFVDGFPVYGFFSGQVGRMLLRYDKEEQVFILKCRRSVSHAEALRFLEKNRAFLKAHRTGSSWIPSFQRGERHYLLGNLVTLGENGVPEGFSAYRNYQLSQLKPVIERLMKRYIPSCFPSPAKIDLKFMDSRWGRCTPQKGAIALNGYLAAYPEKCAEAILVHELTHLYHRDHGTAFYACFTRAMPDWKTWDSMLKDFEPRPLPPEEA